MHNRFEQWLKENGYVSDSLPDNLKQYQAETIRDYSEVAKFILEQLSGEKARDDFFINNRVLYIRRSSNIRIGQQKPLEDKVGHNKLDDIYRGFQFKRNQDKIADLCKAIQDDDNLMGKYPKIAQNLAKDREEIKKYLMEKGLYSEEFDNLYDPKKYGGRNEPPSKK